MQERRKSALWRHAQSLEPSAAGTQFTSRGGTDLKAQMAEIRAQYSESQPEISAAPWIRAAAVLACFNPAKLKASDGTTLSDDDAFYELLDASALAPSSGGLRLLPLAERRRQLRQMVTREDMRRTLAANTPLPDLPIQHAFGTILEGPDAVRMLQETEAEGQMAALAEVLLWVEDILPDLPDRTQVLEDLAQLRLSSPLRTLVGKHFAGREKTIAKLNDYIRAPKDLDRIYYLHGTGGTGKSTVLAKFALDLRDTGEVDQFVYLNFDRPALDVREPLTVLREIVVQLHAQTHDSVLQRLLDNIDDYTRRFASNRSVLDSSFDGGGGWPEMISAVSDILNEISGTGPVLVLLDTFESAQRVGESAVRDLWRMFTALAENVSRLRIIAAGRVDSFGLFSNKHELAGLEPNAVAEVLESICGQPLPADVVDEVMKTTNGRPLGVVLAGHYFKRLGPARLANPQVRADALLDVQSEQAEAVLYNRVLGQISDARVRRLTRPGLLLRFVTPGLIRDVLGPITGQTFDESDAQAVFQVYQSEVDLVEPGVAVWGEPLLTHRADVRALMLPDLRAFDPAQVRDLDKQAIAFFAARSCAMARAEEIYHRCFVDETVAELSARWEPDCAPFLQDALPEVPIAKRPWLANRLGVDLPAEAAAQADLSEWEVHAVRTAQNYLNSDDLEGALKLLDERTERLPGSPLYALEADALSRLDRVAEARTVLDRGLQSAADAGLRGAAAELYLIRSLIHERNREFAVAGRDALRAYQVAKDLQLKELMLRALTVLMRLHRKSYNIAGPASEDLIAEANAILDDVGDAAMRDHPGLMRQLAGELGPTRPDLVARSVQVTGQDVISTPSDELLRAEAAATEELVTAKYDNISDITAQIQNQDDNTLRDMMKTLVSVATERGMLDQIAGPLANVISAEVDQLIGAFPSKSMQKRSTAPTWRRALETMLRARSKSKLDGVSEL